MKVRRLDSAEKWLRDGIDACQVPAYFESLETDMSQARTLIETTRTQGLRITYVHILVRAVALALKANPDLNQLVCGGRVHRPGQVDIALSVAGESIAAPLLVIQAADLKSVSTLASEISRRAPEVRDQDRKMLLALRRWGWLLPLSPLRKAILRLLFRIYKFRRKGAGTFQVSVLPAVDQAMSPVFSASAMLAAGGVKDRVVVIEGRIAVRPTLILTCCADHRAWDGRAGQRFLLSVRQILESATLLDEATQPVDNTCALVASAGCDSAV